MSISTARCIVIIVGAILFFPFLGAVPLFDWDEINFAESAREMIMSNDYFRVQINYQPFWEKPPLFMWLQVFSMKIFGINEFAARLPNAVIGIVTLLIIFNVGNRLYDRKLAFIWVAAYIGTFLPHFYFKSGIIDPLFNLFIFLGIIYLHYVFNTKNFLNTILAGLFVGLAILTKGPVALLIVGLCAMIYLLASKKISWSNMGFILIFVFTVLLFSSLWFGVETYKHGSWFVNEFIKYNMRLLNTEDSGHGQPVYYHPIVLLIGCFPMSIFMFKYLFKPYQDKENGGEFMLWMKILFWCVLVIFSIVKTKIVHYSSLCYFPITFIGSYTIYAISNKNNKVPSAILWFVSIIGVLWSIGLLAIPLIPKYKEYVLPYINDNFAKANIADPVIWIGFEWLIGVVLLIAIIVALFYRKNILTYSLIIFSGVAISIQSTLYFIVPKLERHIQGNMIDFFKSIKNENCYVKVLGFKSYAPYFYTNRQPNYGKQNVEDELWLMNGEIDKTVYFITKNDRDYYRLNPNLEIIMDKGGYVAYKRTPKIK